MVSNGTLRVGAAPDVKIFCKYFLANIGNDSGIIKQQK